MDYSDTADNMRFKHFLIAISTSLLCACNTTEEEGQNFHHISDPAYTPEDISNWQAYVLTFSADTCSSIQYYPQLESLTNIEASGGSTVAILAMESSDNTGLTNIKKGGPADSYMVVSDDRTAIAARTWGAVFRAAEGQKEFRPVLSPVTSQIRMTVIESPEEFVDARLELSGFHNAWSPYSNEYLIRGNAVRDEIICSGEEVLTNIFPPLEKNGNIRMNMRVRIGKETYDTYLDVDARSLLRTAADICFDFTNYLKKHTFDIVYRYRSIINAQSEKEVRKTVSTSSMTGKPDNRHYRVQIHEQDVWTDLKVHDALCSNADKHAQIWNDWSNRKALRDTMSYCLIDTEFPARIRVRKNTSSFTQVEIRPSTYGIETVDCGDGIIEFTIPSADKGKISVEFDGDRQHNLFIYAREPDLHKPTGNSSDVRYFGKGEHHAGTIRLRDGQTLYIDYGAKVYGKVKTEGNNITIAGHGILSGEKLEHLGDNQYSWGDFLISHNESKSYVRNLTVKDITMIDSPGWNLIIPQTDGVVLDGINMISWELNGDGIDIVSSRDVEIRNCFIRTYDDCITLKCRFIVSPITDVSNVRISDCLIWADFARGLVIGPEAGNQKSPGRLHDIRINNCIFLQHKRGQDDDLRAAFAIGQGSDGNTGLWRGDNPPRTISDVYASGLYFDNIDKKGRHTAIWQYGDSPVYMENINLSDFTIIDRNCNIYPAMTIKTNGSSINGLSITDFTVNGDKMTSSSSMLSIDKPGNVDISIQ